MERKTIEESLDVYRKSRDEWISRAKKCEFGIHACDGAIEALEGLLNADTLDNVTTLTGAQNG